MLQLSSLTNIGRPVPSEEILKTAVSKMGEVCCYILYVPVQRVN